MGQLKSQKMINYIHQTIQERQLTIYILIKVGVIRTFSIIGSTPIVLFCFIFALTFAFAVGISSYNFGTLVRYKIPLMPFYVAGLYIMEGFIEKKVKRRK